jgi:hypothetical protein
MLRQRTQAQIRDHLALTCGHLRAVVATVTSFITFFSELAADVDNLRTDLQRLKNGTISECHGARRD